MFTQATERPWAIDYPRPTYIYPMIAISTNAWSFYYIWHSFGFRNERLLNLLLLLLQDFLLLSLHVRSWNAFNCHGKSKSLTGKAIRSRQKQIAHGKTKFTHGKSKSTKMRYFYSGGQSVLEVLLLFTVGHRWPWSIKEIGKYCSLQ